MQSFIFSNPVPQLIYTYIPLVHGQADWLNSFNVFSGCHKLDVFVTALQYSIVCGLCG